MLDLLWERFMGMFSLKPQFADSKHCRYVVPYTSERWIFEAWSLFQNLLLLIEVWSPFSRSRESIQWFFQIELCYLYKSLKYFEKKPFISALVQKHVQIETIVVKMARRSW